MRDAEHGAHSSLATWQGLYGISPQDPSHTCPAVHTGSQFAAQDIDRN